jgi:hypothetical protein
MVKELAKVTNTSGTYLRTATVESSSIRMRLKKANQTGYHFDAMVKFEEGSSDGFDQNREMHLLSGPSYDFGFPNEAGNMLLNSQYELLAETRIVPMEMNLKGQNGSFEFEVLSQSIPAGSVAYIRDNYLGEITEITQGSIFGFETNGGASSASNRFELIINPGIFTSASQHAGREIISIFPNPTESGNGTLVSLKGFSGTQAQLQVTDLSGRVLISEHALLNNGSFNYQLNTGKLAAGVYSLSVSASGKTQVRKLVVR